MKLLAALFSVYIFIFYFPGCTTAQPTDIKKIEQIQKGLPLKITITSAHSDSVYLLLVKHCKKAGIKVLSEYEYNAEKKAFFTAQFSKYYKETVPVTREEIMSNYNKTPPILQDLLVHFYSKGNSNSGQVDSIKWKIFYFPENRHPQSGVLMTGGNDIPVVIDRFVKTIVLNE